MSHIFISYSRNDGAYIARLIKALQEKGFDVWFDKRMNAGAEWHKDIEKHIDDCAAFIVVMSNNSKASEWVLAEVLYAKKKKKAIFPLLLQGDIWLAVQNLNPVDVTDKALPDDRFFEHLATVAPQRKDTSPFSFPKPRQPRFNFDPKLAFRILLAVVALIGIVFGSSRLSSYLSQIEFPTPLPTDALTFAPAIPNVTVASPLGIGSTMISEKDGATLVYVPAGEFTMGSDNGGPAEKPIHKVTLDSFWIDQTEVTNELYAKCVDAIKCPPPNNTDHFLNAGYAQHPVVYVDWNQASAYCAWTGRRLPTEAEWEKAARGTDERTYPWGDKVPDSSLLNYNNEIRDTTPVKNYPDGVSPYGAYDMAGNAWEWVNDWYGETYYQSSPSLNPLGTDSGQYRAVRGGSWGNYYFNVRSASRNYGNNPTYTDDYAGFRCARSLLP